MLSKKVVHPRILLALSAIGLAAIFIIANPCYAADLAGPLSQTLITKENASQKIIAEIVPNISSSLRVNLFPTLLDAGSRVTQASDGGGKTQEYLTCEHQSWLFFIDLSPGAHFAHPAVIVLLDAVNGEIKSMDAEWWPVIEDAVFDNIAERQDPSTIVFER